jgi:hypothetical protein
MRFDGAEPLRMNEAGDLRVSGGGRELRQLRPVVYQPSKDGVRRYVAGRYHPAGDLEVRFALGEYDREQTLVIDPVLVYSSFLGGALPEIGASITVDPRGKVWVAGNTSSEGLPARGGPFAEAKIGGQDIFIARFDPTVAGDSSLEMLTYFGGTGLDEVKAIQASPAGFIALAGSTTSTDFPLAGNSYKTTSAGERDVFVALMNPFEAFELQFAYSTYLGGDAVDVANAVFVDEPGNIYVTGYTTSSNFPLSSAPLQPNKRGGYDMFITKLVPSRAAGQNLDYSTYLGSNTTDVAEGIAADASGFIYVGGYTFAEDFPVAGSSFRADAPGNGDAVLVKIDPTKGFPDALVYGSYFGGNDFDKLYSLKLDAAGGIVIAGYTDSTDFPVTQSAYQRTKSGDSDLFIARFDLNRAGAAALTYSTYLGGSSTDILYSASVDGSNRVAVAGYTLSENFPAKGQAIQNGFGGAIDAFVAWIDPAGSGDASLLGSTLIGGNNIDAGYGVAADFRGRAYLTGFCTSNNFPVTSGAFSSTLSGIYDSFLVAIDY